MSLPTTSRRFALRRGRLPLLAVITFTAALTLAPTTPATAHSKLSGSRPADGARLASTPSALAFTFDQTLQPVQGWDAVLVTGPDGNRHPARSVQVEGDTLHATCDRLGAAGVYTISYRVISGDGHPIAGHITVTLARTDPGSRTASAMVLPTDGVPAWLWIGEFAVVLFLLRGFRRWRSDLAAPADPAVRDQR
jgi:methionine-rich copper-binding protein CopC